MVLVINKQELVQVDQAAVENTVQAFLDKLGLADWSVAVIFVGPDEMAEYNQAYRKKAGPTNVLAFPLYPDKDPDDSFPEVTPDCPADLGDIFVCPDIISKEAISRGVSFADRLNRLLAHSTMHLLGYDHQTDLQHEKMLAKEGFLLGCKIDPELD